ncbi:putative DD41D transposase [Trichonephila clavipes]|nr:putative DD41D transposase [Trichonephila clavipes]
MITNFFIPELNNHDVQELWFQQDGATCHTARATIDLLKDTLGDRLISRFGPVNWPPRSCDLTPLDYFLWGYVKSLVYANKPQTLDHLEDNIRRVIAYIRLQMLEKVIKNWTSRLDYIRASRGSPMPEIIFKIEVLTKYRYRTVACLVTSSRRVPPKTRRVGQRCTLNLSRAETSSRWCGVVVRRGGASSGVVHVT